MKFSVKTTIMRFRTASIISMLCFSISGFAGTARFGGAQLQSYREILDSLEVALQARNRAGLQPDSIEEKIALCRDSIALYRHLEENGKALHAEAPLAGTGSVSLLSILDVKAGMADLAAFLGVGRFASHPFMVLFSGPTLAALLLLGFLLVTLSIARRRLKVGGQRAATRRAAVFYEQAQRVQSPALCSGELQSARHVGAPPSPPQTLRNTDDNEPLELFAPVEVPLQQPGALPGDGEARDERHSAGISQTIEALIVSANEEGLSVREISRRYHVSVDQVGLAMALVKKR